MPIEQAQIDKRLLAYRITAWVTGIGLLILTVGVVLDWGFHLPLLAEIVGPIHGFLYMAYIVCTLLLAERCRWKPLDALVILACGTIPVASFVAERRVTRRVHEGLTPLASSPLLPGR